MIKTVVFGGGCFWCTEAVFQFENPITTEIIPLNKFFTAEDYHQNYYQKNLDQPYCTYVIVPKLEKLKEKFKKSSGIIIGNL